MNKNLLQKYIKIYIEHLSKNADLNKADDGERKERMACYQTQTADKILKMTADDIYDYIAKLWAMRIWGNKHYVVDKIIKNNGLERFRSALADLVWGKENIATRWDQFREEISSVGPAMMSEILCYVHPDTCMLWNRRASVGLQFLNVKDLPRYDYQLTGAKYEKLCEVCFEIADEIRNAGVKNVNLLWVDYFIWSKLQIEKPLPEIIMPSSVDRETSDLEKIENTKSKFVHNDIRDKIADIGQWLGFQSAIEKKVANGAQVDAIWEATIGNMGRVIYVFEVQTGGGIKSLILNLLKSLNNTAVQGVVAVSDTEQIEKIKKEVVGVHGLRDKLKYWNYKEVLKVHEALAEVYTSINALSLVPQGF